MKSSTLYLLPSEEVSVPDVVENDDVRALRAALMRLDRGRSWWGGPKDATACPSYPYCTITAALDDLAMKESLRRALGVETFQQVYEWNDHPTRTFADVETLYLRAITLAGTP